LFSAKTGGNMSALKKLFFPHSQIILVGGIVFLKKVCTFATHFGQKPFWSEN
jgi:hypothetical protein